jgi:hypothetical protein
MDRAISELHGSNICKQQQQRRRVHVAQLYVSLFIIILFELELFLREVMILRPTGMYFYVH